MPTVDRRQGIGACFVPTLCFCGVKAMHILVEEDHADLAASIVGFLETKGCTVDFAQNGPTGDHIATTHAFDAIVIDIGLPMLDGISLCRKLRDEPKLL